MKDHIVVDKIDAISNQLFLERYIKQNRPVIIRGAIEHWDAIGKWDIHYLHELMPGALVKGFKIIGSKYDINPSKGSVIEDVSIESCLESHQHHDLDWGTAIACPISLLDERLRKDYTIPEYCKDYSVDSMLFMGPAGLITPLHQDFRENLYALIGGKKRILLFHPSERLHPYCRLSKLYNFSQVDPEHPDYQRFPDLYDCQPYLVELKAGDILYIPSLWWHYLRNEENAVAINFWWQTGWKRMLSKVINLLKGLFRY